MGRPTTPALNRFWPKVSKTKTCWLWTGAKHRQGYGQFWFDGRIQYAHRAAFVLLVRSIPGSAVVRHACDTPACINPRHLKIGSQKENVRDRVDRGRSAAGEKHGRAKLSNAQISAIRKQLAAGAERTALAKKYRVSSRHIGYVFLNESRKTKEA